MPSLLWDTMNQRLYIMIDVFAYYEPKIINYDRCICGRKSLVYPLDSWPCFPAPSSPWRKDYDVVTKPASVAAVQFKLQALVYDIFPSGTAVFSFFVLFYVTYRFPLSENCHSANDQFFVGAHWWTVLLLNLLQTLNSKLKKGVSESFHYSRKNWTNKKTTEFTPAQIKSRPEWFESRQDSLFLSFSVLSCYCRLCSDFPFSACHSRRLSGPVAVLFSSFRVSNQQRFDPGRTKFILYNTAATNFFSVFTPVPELTILTQ